MSAWSRRAVVLSLVSSLSLLLAACGAPADQGPGSEGPTSTIEDELALAKRAAVFTLNNQVENAVLAFKRAADGTLTPAGQTLTGGAGSAGGLGSQGALTLSANGRWLLAVNAGSNQISTFSVSGTELTLVDVVSSGGVRPISVAVRGSLVYVVNAGGSGNVSGFRLDSTGHLHPIAGSTQPLSAAGSAPAQVSLTSDLHTLVVTEKATDTLSTYAVHADGSLGSPVFTTSSGKTPFGFALSSDDTLVISEAFGGVAGAGAMSTYRVGSSGAPSVVSATVRNGQTAPCWVAITGDDAYAYVTNTGTGNVSGYSLDTVGGLSLFADSGITATTGEGSRPTDLALSHASRFLYVLGGGSHELTAFQVQSNGALVPVPLTGASGFPAGTVGVVAI